MWDARLNAIRERKLREIADFAGLVRDDPTRKAEYIEIIELLNRDVRVIDALSSKTELPESEPILSNTYRDRLSKMDLLDEQGFDASRRTVFTDEDRKAPETDEDEGPAPEIYDMILDINDAVSLKTIREMKNRKIDLFIEREMSGRFKDTACEDVISFLKTDIKLIDKIMAINITSKESIETALKDILEYVEKADEPKHQKMYLNSLNMDEQDLEGRFNDILMKLDSVIRSRYSYIVGEESENLFFQ